MSDKVAGILPAELNGVIFVTGRYGVGKSIFASTADIPSNVAYFDFDNKGDYLNQRLKFGMFEDVMADIVDASGTSYDPMLLYTKIDKMFAAIPANRYTVAVLDNIEPLENALAAEVGRDPKAYGVKAGNVSSGSFGGVYPGVSVLVGRMVSRLRSKGIRLIIATAHVKAVWATSGVVPNKGKPKGVTRWQELSMLTLALIPGDVPPIPSAIVYKEALGSVDFNPDTGDFDVKRRLPTRMPAATWGAIRKYLVEGANFDQPAPGETATAEEYGEFSDKYTGPQMEFIKLSAEAAARGIVTSEDGPNGMTFQNQTGSQPVLSGGASKIDHNSVYAAAKAIGKFKEAQDLFKTGATIDVVVKALGLKL